MSNLQAIIHFIHLGKVEVNERDLYGRIITATDPQIGEIKEDRMMDDVIMAKCVLYLDINVANICGPVSCRFQN